MFIIGEMKQRSSFRDEKFFKGGFLRSYMAFKLNISNKGKAWKLEAEGDFIVGKSVGERFNGKELSSDFAGYELEITGGSDVAGFPLSKDIEGIGLRRVLRKKGWGMWDNTSGIRRRKTTRGKIISDKTVQININVVKEGNKKLNEIFPDQNKKEETIKNETEEKAKEIKESKEKVKEIEEKTEKKNEDVNK